MTNSKKSSVALLGAMAMMSATNAYSNAYEDLMDETKFVAKPTPKTPLSKKQVKARQKSKAARKARKK